MNRVTRYQSLSATVRKAHGSHLVGVVQCRSTSDIEANFEQNQEYINQCVDRGASIVCLPEFFAYMHHPGIPSSWSEPLNGKVMEAYRKLAQNNRCWLSLGGFQEHENVTVK